MFRLLKIAITAIVKNKLRSFLTVLGIIIGVGAVIIMVSIGKGASEQIEKHIAGLGTNLIVVYPGSQKQGSVKMSRSSSSRLKIEDAEKVKDQATLLSGVSPVVLTRGQIIGGESNWNTTFYGVSTDYLDIRTWELSEGEMFSERDIKNKAKVCILGKTVADNLFPNGGSVGQKVRVKNLPVEIIGVLESKGQDAHGNDADDILIAPYSTVNARLSRFRFIRMILCSAENAEEMDEALIEVTELMRIAKDIEPGEEDNFTVQTQTQIMDAATESSNVMTVLLASIASVSLLVGGIGIMNIMLVSVTERTREIGVRMAMGARENDILIQFLVEAVVLSLIGGGIGILLGFGGIYLVEHLSDFATAVDSNSIVLAFVFSGLVGIVFGFLPARKAAKLNPIDALQYQ